MFTGEPSLGKQQHLKNCSLKQYAPLFCSSLIIHNFQHTFIYTYIDRCLHTLTHMYLDIIVHPTIYTFIFLSQSKANINRLIGYEAITKSVDSKAPCFICLRVRVTVCMRDFIRVYISVCMCVCVVHVCVCVWVCLCAHVCMLVVC